MPGPGKKNKAKKKPGSHPSAQSAPLRHSASLAADIDGAEGWDAITFLLCDVLEIPGMLIDCSLRKVLQPEADLSTRSGLKRIHTNCMVGFSSWCGSAEALT
jgi:hypothetical protein